MKICNYLSFKHYNSQYNINTGTLCTIYINVMSHDTVYTTQHLYCDIVYNIKH